MKKIYLLFILIASFSFGQTTLMPGEVMIVGFYGDGESPSVNCNEAFAFVSFVDLLDTTVIRFSEEDYSAWPAGTEGDLVWTNNTGGTISALTGVNIITHGEGVSCGSPLSVNIGSVAFEGPGNWGFGATNEEIIVHQGVGAQTLGTGLAISLFHTSDITAPDIPPGITASETVNIMALDDDADLAVYTGPATFTDLADFKAQMTNTAVNWATQDGVGDSGQDGTFPDYPDHLKGAFFPTLGVENAIFENFKLFPNPATDILNFSVPSNSDVLKVQIMDITGKRVFNIDEISNGQTMDVSALKAGIYFVQLQSGDTKSVKKLIKQ